MDNLTHSLAAVALAKGASDSHPRLRSNLLLWASLAGNNFPDLDFLLGPLTGGKLGYLLHHRGHTHTLLGVLPQWAMILGIFWIVTRFSKTKPSASEWKWIGIVSAIGLVLHIFFDSWNSYGVHPFWPWNNEWYYGDGVFIIEPFLWLMLVPIAFRAAKTSLGRVLSLGIGFLGIALGATLGRYSLGYFAIFMTLHLLWYLWAPRAAFRRVYVAGVSLSLLWVAMLLGMSPWVKHRFETTVSPTFENGSWLETIATSAPANPFCWWLLGIESSGDKKLYRIHRGTFSFAGVPATSCVLFDVSETTAETLASPIPQTRSQYFPMMTEGSIEGLNDLAAKSCVAHAALRFMRAPFYSAEQQVLGDFRFDREKGLGFSEIKLEPSATCPANIPQWKQPFTGLSLK